MKVLYFLFVSLILVCSTLAVQTKNDSTYKLTFLISSGTTTNDSTYKYSSTMEQQGVGNYTDNTHKFEIGVLYNLYTTTITEEVSNAHTRHYLSTAFYDVIVDIEKPRYIIYKFFPKRIGKFELSKEIVKANITIINKGDIPDKDAVLTYYIISPNNKIFQRTSKTFEEVMPICEAMTYDGINDICVSGNVTKEPIKYVENIEVSIPSKAEIGEWHFVAEYETQVQPLIKAEVPFEIVKSYFVVYSILIILIVILLKEVRWKKKNDGENS